MIELTKEYSGRDSNPPEIEKKSHSPLQWGIMIDEHGYRQNVGIVLANANNQVLWARRCRSHEAWQFPQGGIQEGELLEQALYRELHEELGLHPRDVAILGTTEDWLYYDLPEHFRRYHQKPLCIGQKQKWFLLRLQANDTAINLSHTALPEFDTWRWVDFWYPLDHVIDFKRLVYEKALTTLEKFLRGER